MLIHIPCRQYADRVSQRIPGRVSRPRNPSTVEGLVGVNEIGVMLTVHPRTVTQWRLRDINFPEPDLTLSGSPIWKTETVRSWAVKTGRI